MKDWGANLNVSESKRGGQLIKDLINKDLDIYKKYLI